MQEHSEKAHGLCCDYKNSGRLKYLNAVRQPNYFRNEVFITEINRVAQYTDDSSATFIQSNP